MQQEAIFGSSQPKRLTVLFHLRKTALLIGSLITDRRVSLWRKLFFGLTIACLLLVLLFPDALNETFLSVVMPVIGTIAGVPIDAGFDWLVFALIVVNLLKLFPPTVVAEHYHTIFEQ